EQTADRGERAGQVRQVRAPRGPAGVPRRGCVVAGDLPCASACRAPPAQQTQPRRFCAAELVERGGHLLEAAHEAAHGKLPVVERRGRAVARGGIEPGEQGTGSHVALPRREGGVAHWPPPRAPALLALPGAPFVPRESVLGVAAWHGPSPPRP